MRSHRGGRRSPICKIPSTLIMRERPGFERPSFELRVRGSFSAKGDRVYAGTPRALHPMRDELPANRLGLARWLVDPDNPLVARVVVNRLWEQLFGRGLVETSEDFGSQGAPPTPSRAARLARHGAPREGLEPEDADQDDRDVGNLPAVVGRPGGARRARSVQPAVRARAAGAPGSRDDSRRDAGRERPAQRQDARPERLPRAAGRHLEHAVQLRQVDRQQRRGSLPPQPVYVLAAHVAVSELHDVRRDQPGVLHGAPRPHQHAACRR